MRRLILAFRAFFSTLSGGEPPRSADAPEPPAPPPPEAPAAAGALQLLAILQREARLVDFLMEDLGAYSDAQVGAAARAVHEGSRQALLRHIALEPIIDGIEGSFIRLGAEAVEPSTVRFLGNVAAQGTPEGGLLRHRGWRARRVELPAPGTGQQPAVIAPAEIEVE